MLKTLNQYSELLEALYKSFVDQFEFQSNIDFAEIMKQPRLVIALNHSTPLSWLPAASALAVQALKCGGGHRIPRGIMDHWFYSTPLTRFIAQYFSQSEKPLKFDELLQEFKSSEHSDIVIFPEGANTFFCNSNEIEEFRSSRFVELAIRAKAPLLLVTHKGSENWSIPLKISADWASLLLPYSSFFGPKLLQKQSINLPLIPQKIPQFKMNCELYWPELTLDELSEDSATLRTQISNEAGKVRVRMQSLLAN